MKKSEIIAAIESKVGKTDYTIWRIGITQNVEERKIQHRDTEKQNVTCWSQWQADSLSDAQEIETHFINNKKMKGGTGGDLSPYKTTFVYVF